MWMRTGSFSGRGWDFSKNSLDIYGNGYEGYVDYRNADKMMLVNALKVNPSIFDYMFPVIYGFRNHVHYNKHKFIINYEK
jgi:hypothetical protein